MNAAESPAGAQDVFRDALAFVVLLADSDRRFTADHFTADHASLAVRALPRADLEDLAVALASLVVVVASKLADDNHKPIESVWSTLLACIDVEESAP